MSSTTAHHPRPLRSRRGGPQLTRAGLSLGAEIVPLYAASVHYWRLRPEVWPVALRAVRKLGFRLIDTYVPWAVHESAPGELDFGDRDSRLDLAKFLRLAREADLYAIVRPGPHINAELTRFGIPEWVIWDEACQARSAHRKPVVLPVPPLAFPVPSYASEAFFRHAGQWLHEAASIIAPLCWPNGPVVAAQVDNEGAFYFRDGILDQDYHPDAIAAYREFSCDRYQTTAELRRRHNNPTLSFAKLQPPTQLKHATPVELIPLLDWAEFQEVVLERALTRFAKQLSDGGMSDIVTLHNLPPGEAATPLDPARVEKAVDLVGLDYYHGADADQHRVIFERTTELVARARAHDFPAYAAELGVGFPPFFPALRERDSEFATLCALAYGLRGFNLYMAVERDRWIGSPIDDQGRERPGGEFWRTLLAALERVRFHELSRQSSARIVVPRSYRRLVRVLHAFGPLSTAFFAVAGRGAAHTVLEGPGEELGKALVATDLFFRALCRGLDTQGIDFEIVSGDLLDPSAGALRMADTWTIVLCPGVMEAALLRVIEDHWASGSPVSLAPFVPTLDAELMPLRPELVLPQNQTNPPPLIGNEPGAISSTMAEVGARYQRQELRVTGSSVFSCVHEDENGVARVLFLINPGSEPSDATVHGARLAVDLLTNEKLDPGQSATLSVTIAPRSVRMLELSEA